MSAVEPRFAQLVERFFLEWLPTARRASPHTVSRPSVLTLAGTRGLWSSEGRRRGERSAEVPDMGPILSRADGAAGRGRRARL